MRRLFLTSAYEHAITCLNSYSYSLDGDLALVNYYRYYTPSGNPLTKTFKLTLSTSTLRKHLTLSITKFFSTSLRHTVCHVIYMNGSRTISVVVVKGLWLMELHLIGCQLHLECRKSLSWVLFCL